MSQAQRIHQDAERLGHISRLVWDASDAIMAVYKSDAFGESTKADDSPVTEADLAAHRVLVDGLAALTPDIPIVSEEDADSVALGREHPCYWLIDPLDGTKEFINQRDEFTVNIALIERLELAFEQGFTVLTGETGAGKSLLLDALDASWVACKGRLRGGWYGRVVIVR